MPAAAAPRPRPSRRFRTVAAAVGAVVAVAIACGGSSDAAESLPPAAPAEGAEAGCRRVSMGTPNAGEQRPTFPGQTRACAAPPSPPFTLTVVARGLASPWAVEPLPGGRLLVSERGGALRLVAASGQVGPPIAGVPRVDARGQGGLLDVALSPGFASDRLVYWSYSEPRQGGNGTSVARGRLSADGARLEGVRVIFRARPTYDGSAHFGSRLVFGRDGMLYVTLGERSDREIRPQAQQLGSHMGKVLRLRPDGGVPPDNPFVGRAGALPEIWSLGHRNVQSAALDLQGRLWTVEHGPRGGDELNRIERGKNYGWPVVTFGEEYTGLAIDGARTTRPGYVDPVYYWDPVIAPSGMEIYSGDAFPAWRGNVFIGALRGERLVRLVLGPDGRVRGEEHLLADRGRRIRDVRQGPDGSLWLVTDASDGELWRLGPRR